jgi:hypothetical protein
MSKRKVLRLESWQMIMLKANEVLIILVPNWKFVSGIRIAHGELGALLFSNPFSAIDHWEIDEN